MTSVWLRTILNYLTNERLKSWGLLSNFKIILKVSFLRFQTQVFPSGLSYFSIFLKPQGNYKNDLQ